MADKIKEALFSSLASLGVHPDRILDLYAGSGAVGIEALSRGGTWCDFVDRDQRACDAISANLQATGFENLGRIYRRDSIRFVQALTGEHYDFVIIDPPYAASDIQEQLLEISESNAVRHGTIVVLGHWPQLEVSDRVGCLETLRTRCHGSSCFTIFEVVCDQVAEVL